MGRVEWIVAALGFLTLTHAVDAAAQVGTTSSLGQIESVRMNAEPSATRDTIGGLVSVTYDVILTYELSLEAGPVNLIALGLDGVGLQAISARLDGELLTELEWERNNPQGNGTQSWTAVMPARVSGPSRTLEFRYAVTGALRSFELLTLPIVIVGVDPPAALPGVFEARVQLPDEDGQGAHVRQSFPTDVRGGSGPEDPIVVASLAVLPRTLRLKLGRGAASPWARLSWMEVMATVLILGLGALGWRHLVRSV